LTWGSVAMTVRLEKIVGSPPIEASL